MPPFEVTGEDTYLCTSIQLPDRPLKLVEIEARADQSVVHHILMFGCKEPARKEAVWDCRMASACAAGGELVLYGWGRNAPAVKLPANTAYSVGAGTGATTLVLQVHYLNLRPPNDTSGVALRLSERPARYSAGLVAYASSFTIPPGKPAHLVENECCYTGFEPARGFAFRVHAHALGRQIYLDRLAADGSGNYSQVVSQDPQEPQGFYPIQPQTIILPGDRLRATCRFDSTAVDHPVMAGSTHGDEMCNLYLMMYSELPHFGWCANGAEWQQQDGAGGLPAAGTLLPEERWWKPPRELQVAPPAGNASGRVPPLPAGQATGVAVREGTAWALYRGDRVWRVGSPSKRSFDDQDRITVAEPIRGPVVVQMEQDSGKVLRSWGTGLFYMPHMITVDFDGNLWIVDVGLHQAIKFSPEGKQLLALGTRLTPGNNDTTLCKPTQVAVARDGRVFVADGYCGSRVVRYSRDGQYQAQYQMPAGKAPMAVPHALAINECTGRLYVADREGKLVHAFGLEDGALIGTWDVSEHGLPYDLALGPYGTILVLTWQRGPASSKEKPSVKLLSLGSAPGAVQAMWGAPGVNAAHQMALLPAPLEATGAGERQLAVLIGETREQGSQLLKFTFPLLHGKAGDNMEAGQQPEGMAASHSKHTKLKPAGGGNVGSYASLQGGGGKAAAKVEPPPPQQQQSPPLPSQMQPPLQQKEKQQHQHQPQLVAGAPAAEQAPGRQRPVKQQLATSGSGSEQGGSLHAFAKSAYAGIVLGVLVVGVAVLFFTRMVSWRSHRGYEQAQAAATEAASTTHLA